MTFFRQQLTRIATHILRCNGKLNFSSLFPHFVSNSSLKSLFVGNVILVTAIHSLFFIIQFKLCFPDETFGPQLLQMCNQALFECLALNLHCLRGDQRALTAVINHRIVCTQFPLSKKKYLSQMKVEHFGQRRSNLVFCTNSILFTHIYRRSHTEALLSASDRRQFHCTLIYIFLSLHHQLASTSVNSELLQVKHTVYTLFETVQV